MNKKEAYRARKATMKRFGKNVKKVENAYAAFVELEGVGVFGEGFACIHKYNKRNKQKKRVRLMKREKGLEVLFGHNMLQLEPARQLEV